MICGTSDKNVFGTSPSLFLTFLLRYVLPLLGPVRPRALPLGVVAPRVPDPDQGEEALLATGVNLGTDNLRNQRILKILKHCTVTSNIVVSLGC